MTLISLSTCRGEVHDLPYFYAGPISSYIEDYVQIYDAIKAANPKAVVMNGGLSFAGEEGDRRSREFVRLVPKDKIDAFAYHGHGPGASSERQALERIRNLAISVGKGDKPFIETESGVAANSLLQQRVQARTVVQKSVSAQSEGMPMLHWFRIFITGGDGGYTSIRLRIKNPSQTPLAATLESSVPTGSTIRVLQNSMPVRIAAGAVQEVAVPLEVGAPKSEIVWLRRWTAFVNLPAGKADLSKIASVPGSLSIEGQTFAPKVAVSAENRIDIAALAGGYSERREAVLFAEVVAPEAMTVRMGASADFWMEWFVNGKLLYSTLEKGNGGVQAITAHQFDLPLTAGRNVIAVRVLSGSQGWKVLSGGPQELAEALGQSSGVVQNRISFALRSANGGEPLALESARIEYLTRLAPPRAAWKSAAAWTGRPAHGELGDAGVANPFALEPDSKRWWAGAADLSGRVWLAGDAQHLYIVAAVRDDVHRPSAGIPDAGGNWKSGDALRVAIAAGPTALDLGLSGDGGLLATGKDGKWRALSAADGTLEVRREGDQTWYFGQISRALWPPTDSHLMPSRSTTTGECGNNGHLWPTASTKCWE